MNRHVPDDLLHAFVDGDVDEQVAVHIAEHLDGCPACATRAVTLEPLAAAFAAVEDPPMPPDLVASILTAAEQPERGPLAEVVIGGCLLVAAGLLAVFTGDPLGTAVDLGVAARALGSVSEGLLQSTGVITCAVLAGLACLGLFGRLALTPRRVS